MGAERHFTVLLKGASAAGRDVVTLDEVPRRDAAAYGNKAGPAESTRLTRWPKFFQALTWKGEWGGE